MIINYINISLNEIIFNTYYFINISIIAHLQIYIYSFNINNNYNIVIFILILKIILQKIIKICFLYLY